MKRYFKQNYNSVSMYNDCNVLLAETLYNTKTELENEINYRFDYLFRFRTLPSSQEILDLYKLVIKYEQYKLISKDIFDIIKITERRKAENNP